MTELRNSKDNKMRYFNVKKMLRTPLELNKSVLRVNRNYSVKGKKTSIIGRKWRDSLSNNVLLMKTPHKFNGYECVMFRSWISLI